MDTMSECDVGPGGWIWELDDTPGWGGIVISVRHFLGESWDEAPLPRRLHRCKPQTEGQNVFTLHARCACGALRKGHAMHGRRTWGPWTGKNSRRAWDA